MITTYPRLPTAAAVQLLSVLTATNADELQYPTDFNNIHTYWYATGARRSEQDLRKLADAVRACAVDSGFPRPLGARSARATSFDRQLSRVLLKEMELVPADAAVEDVWSFVSLILLPDIAFWRFPNTDSRVDYERLLGRPRNVFRRLWWRAYTLGPDASAALFEDEAVAIMERPTLAGDRRLARAVIENHLEMAQSDATIPRTELLRQVAKRVRRLSAVLTIPALGDTELLSLVHEVADASLKSLRHHSR